MNVNQRPEYVKRLNTAWPFLVFLGILAVAAYLRFVNLTHQGMAGCDVYQYWIIAKHWAEGNCTLWDGLDMPCFRPVLFFLHSLALRVFGFNDYAIKLLHASLDLLNIALIVLIGRLIAKNIWVGLAAGLIYSGMPSVIHACRYELPHIPSGTFLLVTVLFYVLFDRYAADRKVLAGLLALISGFFLSCTALIHSELAMLGVGFVLMILLTSFTGGGSVKAFFWFLGYAGLFTLGLLSLFIVSGLVMGFGRLWELTLGVSTAIPKTDMVPLQLTAEFLTEGLTYLSSRSMTYMFLGTIPIMVMLRSKGEPLPVAAYLPWGLWLSYGIAFEILVGNEHAQLYRLLIPLLPLASLAVAYWYLKVFQVVLRFSWLADIGLVCMALWLAWANFAPYQSNLRQHRSGYQASFRGVYDVLKGKTHDQARVLVAPYLVYDIRRGLQQGMYLGNQAIYLIDCDPAQTLDEIVREHKIKYILISDEIDKRILQRTQFYRHNLHEPTTKREVALQVLGTCYGMDNASYSLEKEMQLLKAFLDRNGGHMIWKSQFSDSVLYELRDP